MTIDRSATPLNLEMVSSKLKTTLVGKRFISFNLVGSTNDVAKRLLSAQDVAGTVIVAEQQTRGRGRLQRKWASPQFKGLWFSVILKPQEITKQAGLLSLLACTAVSDAIADTTLLEPEHKWPNDILIQGRKCCGILSEAVFTGEVLDSVVIGIGLNVNQAASDFNALDSVKIATSLRIELDATVERESLLASVLNRVEYYYQQWLEHSFEQILNSWKNRCKMLSRQVSVKADGGTWSGTLEDFDESGSLCLRLPSGELCRFTTGSIQPALTPQQQD